MDCGEGEGDCWLGGIRWRLWRSGQNTGVLHCVQDDDIFCGGSGRRLGCGAGVGWQVGGGDLEGLEEQAGALEIDVVAGQAGGDVGEGFLDGGAVVEAFDEEGVVLDDGGYVVGAVVVAHVLVVHGGGAAAGAVLVGFVHALVRLGWFAIEVCVGCWHVVPLPGVYVMLLIR